VLASPTWISFLRCFMLVRPSLSIARRTAFRSLDSTISHDTSFSRTAETYSALRFCSHVTRTN
jgi:hypothetical protein